MSVFTDRERRQLEDERLSYLVIHCECCGEVQEGIEELYELNRTPYGYWCDQCVMEPDNVENTLLSFLGQAVTA